VLSGSNLTSLFTCGLVHAGLFPALWCADGIGNASWWLEVRMGSLQLLAVFVTVVLGAAAGHLALEGNAYGACCPGVCVGLYVAWAVAALTRFRGTMPACSDKGVLYIILTALVAAQQPLIGLGSLLGGALAGAVAVPAAPALAQGLFYAFYLPTSAALVAARIALDTAKVVLAIAATLAYGLWQLVVTVAQTIRGL
jgi:hypothetical protein